MSERLEVRIFIDGQCVVTESIMDEGVGVIGPRHAALTEKAAREGKRWLVEVLDPDQDGKVLVRFGSGPAGMENPVFTPAAEVLPKVRAIARKRLRGRRA